ncbi:CPBP family intramembrane glutamic endopeptidase [Pontixanthobacter sp. CEM42]|uniref:CPBP family intramembrane glutamic endopeptidase n=1 Tax=Pontixanthobacter sp. CEM42 TaxID=2792077 RepID=UPI001AE0839B|nr:CPBP family intramembrane glutamic endopeptidase [Pontixanthobacter sp. CEM42]
MDLFISMPIWWGPVVGLLMVLQFIGKDTIDWRWIGGAVAAFSVYSMVVFWAPPLEGIALLENTQYNWTGKIAAIITTILMILVLKRATGWLTNERLGLTLKQNEGSIGPALIATGAMVALVTTLQLLFGNNEPPSTETLLYQATIPGIDEELLFRGLLLALVAAALENVKHGWRWAGVAVTIIFAFGHSFFFSTDGSQFDLVALIFTGILGALMMYIRLRTGSIALPLVAHNLTNVVNKLIV